VEDLCDKTFPRGNLVRRSSALPSDHDFIRAWSFRGGDSRRGLNRQKEKQSQEIEKAKSIEGPSRQTQSKACIEIVREIHSSVLQGKARNLSFLGFKRKRDPSLCPD
jgi:hypothetical protein